MVPRSMASEIPSSARTWLPNTLTRPSTSTMAGGMAWSKVPYMRRVVGPGPAGDLIDDVLGVGAGPGHEAGEQRRLEGQSGEVQARLRWHHAAVVGRLTLGIEHRQPDPAVVADEARAPYHAGD